MNPSKYITKIVMWLFFIAAVLYFAVYASHVLWSDMETQKIYSYTAEDSMDLTGYLVRKENVLKGSASLEEVVPAEGDRVRTGQTLALVFDSEEAMANHQTLEERQSELDELNYIYSRNGLDNDEGALNDDVDTAIAAVRGAVASGDLSNLSVLTSDLRRLVYRQDFTYNGSGALSEQIEKKEKEVAELEKQSDEAVSTVDAQQSGVFSCMVDGYESVLTPDCLTNLTPSGLEELLDSQKTVKDNAYLGKIITANTWYYVSNLTTDEADRLYEGQTAQVRFNSSIGLINMKVERISDEEDGERCVVFSSDRYLAQMTQLRDQVVDMIFDTVEGFRVSKSAVRVDNATGKTGVYRLYGTQAAWIDVDILWEGEDYYLIQQTPVFDENGEKVTQTQLESAKQLRNGAEIITGGKDMYDGKVITK